MPTEAKLNKLQELLKMVDESLTRKEFEDAFKAILKQILALETKLVDKNNSTADSLNKLFDTLSKKLESTTNTGLTKTIKDSQALIGKALKEQENGLNFIRDKVANLKDGKDGKDADEKKIVADVLAKIPPIKAETPEELKEKLNLEIKDIKDLQQTLDDLEKKAKRVIYTGGGGSGGHVVKAYDISASLSADGSVRTFSLPAFWRVISVHLSSFPNILRPTVDYTLNNSTFQITFTSEIPANSISSSQTCIVIYSES